MDTAKLDHEKVSGNTHLSVFGIMLWYDCITFRRTQIRL